MLFSSREFKPIPSGDKELIRDIFLYSAGCYRAALVWKQLFYVQATPTLLEPRTDAVFFLPLKRTHAHTQTALMAQKAATKFLSSCIPLCQFISHSTVMTSASHCLLLHALQTRTHARTHLCPRAPPGDFAVLEPKTSEVSRLPAGASRGLMAAGASHGGILSLPSNSEIVWLPHPHYGDL